MSRYRKITPINLEEQEQIINQRGTRNNIIRDTRQFRIAPMPRSPLAILVEKLALNRPSEPRNVREVVSSTCNNLRGICKNVRAFTDEMENLLSSVESITPVVEGVVAGYTRSKQETFPDLTRMRADTPPTTKVDPFMPPPVSNNHTDNQESDHILPNTIANSQTNQPLFSKTPTEAELKEFLSNPLVTTLMQMVAKNLGPKR